jgi:excisionase family DNA binding protein
MSRRNHQPTTTTPTPPAVNGKSVTTDGPAAARLPFQLLTAREAATALGVSERTLWALTKKGKVSAVRIGRLVKYDPEDLRAFIERSKEPAAK